MVIFLTGCVCFFSSLIGTICGIGGGVIIKPVLDALGVMDVTVISFLSGCTVLSMTSYSVIRNKIGRESHVSPRQGIPLALGAAVGGLFGKQLFTVAAALSEDENQVGAVQAVCLLVVTLGAFIYTIYKEHVHTWKVENVPLCISIGMVLGIVSSFLGIGGGPINLVVLFYFFSMDTKTAAENSLYIIFFSQTASLLAAIITKNVPDFTVLLLLLMTLCGIGGGILGHRVNKKIPSGTVDKLFIGLMILIIFINIYNIYKFV